MEKEKGIGREVTAQELAGMLADEGLIDDPAVDIVVELIGGYDVARRMILQAVENRKHVVTANKALLALHGAEIFGKAAAQGVDVAFEASVGGGIPILRSVREGLAANRIEALYGIYLHADFAANNSVAMVLNQGDEGCEANDCRATSARSPTATDDRRPTRQSGRSVRSLVMLG